MAGLNAGEIHVSPPYSFPGAYSSHVLRSQQYLSTCSLLDVPIKFATRASDDYSSWSEVKSTVDAGTKLGSSAAGGVSSVKAFFPNHNVTICGGAPCYSQLLNNELDLVYVPGNPNATVAPMVDLWTVAYPYYIILT